MGPQHPSTERLSAYLERELDEQAQADLAEHLDQCSACRAELASLQRTLETLRSLPELEAPTGFSAAVMARIEAQEARGMAAFFRRWRLAPLLAPVAAATLVFLVVRHPESDRVSMPALEQAERVDATRDSSAPHLQDVSGEVVAVPPSVEGAGPGAGGGVLPPEGSPRSGEEKGTRLQEAGASVQAPGGVGAPARREKPAPKKEKAGVRMKSVASDLEGVEAERSHPPAAGGGPGVLAEGRGGGTGRGAAVLLEEAPEAASGARGRFAPSPPLDDLGGVGARSATLPEPEARSLAPAPVLDEESQPAPEASTHEKDDAAAPWWNLAARATRKSKRQAAVAPAQSALPAGKRTAEPAPGVRGGAWDDIFAAEGATPVPLPSVEDKMEVALEHVVSPAQAPPPDAVVVLAHSPGLWQRVGRVLTGMGATVGPPLRRPDGSVEIRTTLPPGGYARLVATLPSIGAVGATPLPPTTVEHRDVLIVINPPE